MQLIWSIIDATSFHFSMLKWNSVNNYQLVKITVLLYENIYAKFYFNPVTILKWAIEYTWALIKHHSNVEQSSHEVVTLMFAHLSLFYIDLPDNFRWHHHSIDNSISDQRLVLFVQRESQRTARVNFLLHPLICDEVLQIHNSWKQVKKITMFFRILLQKHSRRVFSCSMYHQNSVSCLYV